MKRPAVLLALPLLLACAGARPLETRIQGRKAESLQAEAVRSDGLWQISLPLPAGTWSPAAPQEQQEVRVLEKEGRGEARWVVTPERWRDGKPFQLRLRDPQGTELSLEIRYGAYPTAGRVTLNVLYFLAGGRVYL